MKYLYKILLLIYCHFLVINCFSQNYAPIKTYLIDSLDLETLSEEDKSTIDSCLSLFHKSDSDSSKMLALTYLCENINSDYWIDYQFFQVIP